MEIKQATRIQTSILNAAEKKVLVWLAERQPRWVTSDTLTLVGFLGAVTIAAGYVLTNINFNFLWLASLGLLINWYGDSLDGTLARVRGHQRPLYGYYLDHTMDGINESIMCIGAGLSPLMHLPLALGILVVYQLMTVNVSINAHLRKEFKLTYAKLGPTEFRLIVVIVNTVLALVRPLREFTLDCTIQGAQVSLGALDIAAAAILAILLVIYVVTVIGDTRYYGKADPKNW